MMSGDFGPRVTLPAALRALELHPALHLRLVGDGRAIEQQVAAANPSPSLSARLSITHAAGVLDAGAQAREALRGNQDSSLHVCIDLLAAGQVQAVVSAGSTAALVALGRRQVSMLPGFSRPALCSSMPTRSGCTYMLDLGANVDADPESLQEFALMGSALVRALENIVSPRVALLSNGTESGKGNPAIREAARLLEEDAHINYSGFIEGSDIYDGAVEVIVCDGMLGNVALKSAEGTAAFVSGMIRERFSRHWWSRLAAIAVGPILRDLQAALSADQHGGAFLLGLNGVVVKSHGSSSLEAFAAAVDKAARCVERRMVDGLTDILDKQESVQE